MWEIHKMTLPAQPFVDTGQYNSPKPHFLTIITLSLEFIEVQTFSCLLGTLNLYMKAAYAEGKAGRNRHLFELTSPHTSLSLFFVTDT